MFYNHLSLLIKVPKIRVYQQHCPSMIVHSVNMYQHKNIPVYRPYRSQVLVVVHVFKTSLFIASRNALLLIDINALIACTKLRRIPPPTICNIGISFSGLVHIKWMDPLSLKTLKLVHRHLTTSSNLTYNLIFEGSTWNELQWSRTS